MAPLDPIGLFGKLFDSLPMGLVVLDRDGRVVVYNRAEEQLASRSRDAVMGADFFANVAPCMNVRHLGGQFREQIGRSDFDVTVEMSFPFPQLDLPRDVRVRMCSMDVAGAPFGFLLVEDISPTRAVARMREKLQSLLVHDLKNPLAAVMVNLDLLTEMPSVRDAPDALEAIEDALSATRRLGRMTVDLLDLPRLETSAMPLRRTRTSIRAMLARVVNDNRAAARAYGSRLAIVAGDELEHDLDEDLTVRALDNLVENAIRHARNVTLTARTAGDELTMTVADDGPGVPAELLSRVFDAHVQVTGSDLARGQNRGLGLTFVKLVAREHGGDVEAICPASGGTIFTMRLRGPSLLRRAAL